MDLTERISPEQLKRLSVREVEELLPRLRERITEVVACNGGHLASNLGVVELTVALHRVFDAPKDKIIFDVGHQCYTHKILTGRGESFDTLRTFGGISGFPKCSESDYDAFGTGHASTALSAALGMARARDLKGGDEHIIAVVGDGAFTGGMCYEALNDAGSNKTPLIVILNDNQMSINQNVGALSNYLTFMRTSKGWQEAKKAISASLRKTPLVGETLYRFTQRFKNHIRNVFVRDTFFSAMGFRYLGPIDGQDEANLERMLTRAKRLTEPVVLHVVTTKGSGYAPAEQMPDKMHGTPPFHVENGEPKVTSVSRSFGAAAGSALINLARSDDAIVVVTAAMTDSTGLAGFRKAYPQRLFDVGIAEEHAVTLAAGMARGGLKPFVAIYDTFMQRAVDQVIVDVCVQNLPVTFLMDRAALGGEDGPTHHGVFGVSWMRSIPNLTILSPRSVDELDAMIRVAAASAGPIAIRYPRAEGMAQAAIPFKEFALGRWEMMLPGADVALIAVSGMTSEAVKMHKWLKEKGYDAQVVNASTIKPLDRDTLTRLTLQRIPYVVLEEQQRAGGLGSAIMEECLSLGLSMPLSIFALDDRFVEHGTHDELMKQQHLDAESMAQKTLQYLVEASEAQG